jgi:radical SAM superfamily enzyme YgiQ (UPF0313 family)
MVAVTLIRPPVVVARWAHTTPTCPPIGLAYIAASLLSAGHRVRVVDAVGEATEQLVPTADPRFLSHGLSTAEIVARIPPDSKIVALSIMFSHEWPLIRDIIVAIRARFPAVVIVAGGEHVTALGEFSLEQCPELDFCVYGEGEETLPKLIDAVLAGGDVAALTGIVYRGSDGPVRTPPRPRIRAVDDIPPPAWDLFPLQEYLNKEYGFGVNRGRSMPMLATRGCPYRCTFCSNPSMRGTRWVAGNVEATFREMLTYLSVRPGTLGVA